MRGDMVVALGRASVDGVTLFGHNILDPAAGPFALAHEPARTHAPGEAVRATFVELPQVRQTYAALGAHAPGAWGYVHGVNECGVALGCTRVRTRLRLDEAGLTGPDLVRLTLERSHSALQAVEVLTALVSRHGQGAFPGAPPDVSDAAFLVADAREAFLVEASGRSWVWQEVREVRAVSDVCTVRQDWDAIAPGLSGQAIARGWWPEDGTKVDFAGALGEDAEHAGSALRRWGRATLSLEEQSGHIDPTFLRRLMGDHLDAFDGQDAPRGPRAAASLVAQLSAGTAPLAWWSYGPPHRGVYFPLPLSCDLPPGLLESGAGVAHGLSARLTRLLTGGDRHHRARVRAALDGLQALYEGEAADFLAEAAKSKARGDEAAARSLAADFVQHCWEELGEVCEAFAAPPLPEAAEDTLAVF